MAFAIKVEKFRVNPLNNNLELLETKFFSQEIQTLTPKGFDNIVLLTDKDNVGDIDISGTLVEAELKAERINKFIPNKKPFKHGFFKTRIVEFDGLDIND